MRRGSTSGEAREPSRIKASRPQLGARGRPASRKPTSVDPRGIVISAELIRHMKTSFNPRSSRIRKVSRGRTGGGGGGGPITDPDPRPGESSPAIKTKTRDAYKRHEAMTKWDPNPLKTRRFSFSLYIYFQPSQSPYGIGSDEVPTDPIQYKHRVSSPF